jgi:SAM-dependent methyltransferase
MLGDRGASDLLHRPTLFCSFAPQSRRLVITESEIHQHDCERCQSGTANMDVDTRIASPLAALRLWPSSVRSSHQRGGCDVAEPSEAQDGDPYGSRVPTSHERQAGQPWDASYRDGPAPWDIGAPQPAVTRLAAAGVFVGSVLDAGCGTGDNALHIAALGVRVLGVDVAETAVSMARRSAASCGLDAEFMVGDALRLNRLGRMFNTVLDCALFHTLSPAERKSYVAGLASVTLPGSRVYVLCFGDSGPGLLGPHPVSPAELVASFTAGAGWNVVSLGPERLLARFAPDGVPAWLATIQRREGGGTVDPVTS